LLNGEIFYTLKEAQILIERWRREYNTVRPHSGFGVSATGTRSRRRDFQGSWLRSTPPESLG
jgi:transposase InsO family protein